MLNAPNKVLYDNLVELLNQSIAPQIKAFAEKNNQSFIDLYAKTIDSWSEKVLNAKQKGIDLKTNYGKGALIDLYFFKVLVGSTPEHHSLYEEKISALGSAQYKILKSEYIEYLATHPSKSHSYSNGIALFQKEVQDYKSKAHNTPSNLTSSSDIAQSTWNVNAPSTSKASQVTQSRRSQEDSLTYSSSHQSKHPPKSSHTDRAKQGKSKGKSCSIM
ncbi:hypothetical protein NOVO_01395 [Rickettsiales bacterium Ac37b]|nr:hypothetical protein NOVO_01395 [Rickettsiales bacterium Ac37b]